MTCIVAFKKDDHFVFISDSQYTGRYMYGNDSHAVGSKMGHYFDDPSVIMGFTGTARSASITSQIPGLFKEFNEEHPVFNMDYVKEVVLKRIRDELLQTNIITNEGATKLPINFLVAKGDKCYEYKEYGALYEVDNLSIIGSGVNLASGAIYNSKTSLPREIRALKGIDAACKYATGCSYPIIICSTKDNIRYVLNEEETMDIIEGRKEILL